MLIGEGRIPQQVVEELDDRHLQIFLREPDPSQWPREMEPLARFLSEEERIGFMVSGIVSPHDALLRPALESWVSSIRRDLAESKGLAGEDRALLRRAVLKHLESLVEHILHTNSL